MDKEKAGDRMIAGLCLGPPVVENGRRTACQA